MTSRFPPMGESSRYYRALPGQHFVCRPSQVNARRPYSLIGAPVSNRVPSLHRISPNLTTRFRLFTAQSLWESGEDLERVFSSSLRALAAAFLRQDLARAPATILKVALEPCSTPLPWFLQTMMPTGTELSINWKTLKRKLAATASASSPGGEKKVAPGKPDTSLKRKASEGGGGARKKRKPREGGGVREKKGESPKGKGKKMTGKVDGEVKKGGKKLTSASLALWAEDNDIAPEDIAKAYGLPMTATNLPDSGAGARFLSSEETETKKEVGKYIAIDCEMVGVGGEENRSALARVSIVNYHGYPLMDAFVRPKEEVTDWRTWVSGITSASLKNARTFEDVQKDVSDLLQGRILVGHSLNHDLQALLLSHPARDIRDTSRHPTFRKLSRGRTPGLKKLAKEILGIEIQGGQHSSIEDARACMLLYRRYKAEFERLNTVNFPGRKAGGGKRKGKGKGKKK